METPWLCIYVRVQHVCASLVAQANHAGYIRFEHPPSPRLDPVMAGDSKSVREREAGFMVALFPFSTDDHGAGATHL